MTVAKGDYTYVTNTKFDDVELQDLTCPQVQPFTADPKKRKSIPSVVTARVASKIQGNSFRDNRVDFSIDQCSHFH